MRSCTVSSSRLFLPVAFCLACQCMGPVSLDEGSADDPEEILQNMPSLSLSNP